MGFLDGNGCSCSSDKKQQIWINPERVNDAYNERVKKAEKETIITTSLFAFLGLTVNGINSGVINFDSNNFEPRTVEEIEADIDNILKEMECDSISNAELALEDKKIALNEATKNKTTYTNCINTCDMNISNLRSENDKLNAQISQLIQSSYIQQYKDAGYNQFEIDQQVIALENKIAENERKIKEFEENKKEYKALLDEATKVTEEFPALIEQDENLIKNLHKLEKELEKSKEEVAKNSLDKQQNKDTENITEIIKKLRTAQKRGLDNHSAKLDKEAEEAIIKYYQNHKVGDNKTIDNLAKTLKFNLDI